MMELGFAIAGGMIGFAFGYWRCLDMFGAAVNTDPERIVRMLRESHGYQKLRDILERRPPTT